MTTQTNKIKMSSDKKSLKPIDWMELLCEKPELASECNCWSEFDGSEWGTLLLGQPQFADKCTCWSEFDDVQWQCLRLLQPKLADKYEKKFRKWS